MQAEYQVVPHLISTGTASLIDEFYAEVHLPPQNDPAAKKKPLVANRTMEDALDIVANLRRAGVYAHQWS